jgi:type IV secretion system protein VirB10
MRVINLLCYTCLAAVAAAQTNPVPATDQKDVQPGAQVRVQEEPAPQIVTVPSGTKVLLLLKNSVSSRNARPGDGVFLETSFPVVEGGRVVIPAGTYVQGVVDSVKRSGRVKGRAELLLHFTTLIYPNGYTVSMPGSLDSADSADTQQVKDKEGTVKADGGKGKDAGAIATSTGTGVLIGGLTRGAQGAVVGGAIGAAVGVATAMLTRGDEVRLESGSSVEMLLQRPLDLDLNRIDPTARNTSPTPQRYRRLEKPSTNSPSTPGIPRIG